MCILTCNLFPAYCVETEIRKDGSKRAMKENVTYDSLIIFLRTFTVDRRKETTRKTGLRWEDGIRIDLKENDWGRNEVR
jgi:hypothetical protein